MGRACLPILFLLLGIIVSVDLRGMRVSDYLPSSSSSEAL